MGIHGAGTFDDVPDLAFLIHCGSIEGLQVHYTQREVSRSRVVPRIGSAIFIRKRSMTMRIDTA